LRTRLSGVLFDAAYVGEAVMPDASITARLVAKAQVFAILMIAVSTSFFFARALRRVTRPVAGPEVVR
jgi:hypothetical protein